jgi:hypothetical protein
MTRARCFRHWLAAVVLGIAVSQIAPGALQAQTPAAADELLRLVSDDAAFCLVVRDVREHALAFGASPFMAQFRQSPIGATLSASKDLDAFAEIDRQLRQFLNIGLVEIRDEILGDGLVFAYWPAQGAEPERGVFLAKARKAELLQKLVTQLKDIGLKSGDLKNIEARSHKGWEYHRGEDKQGKHTFFLVHDRLLALSEDEASIRRVIESAAAPPATSGISQRLEQLGVRDALAVLLVNPRAFDAALAEKARTAPEAEAGFLRALTAYWKQTSAIALSLRLDKELSLGVSLRVDPAGLPEGTRRFLSAAAKPSELWAQFPERTILAMAGRVDAAALLDLLLSFAPEDKKREQLVGLEQGAKSGIGLDLQKEILPNIGPDLGLFVAAPQADAQDWFPHIVLAVRVQSQPPHKPLDEAVFEPLRTLAGLFAIGQSKDGHRTEVKTLFVGGVPMVTLSGAHFPPGCRPTLAVKSGCVVLASSPAALQRLRERPTALPGASDDRVVLVRLAIQEAVAYLNQKSHRAGMLEYLAKVHGLPRAEVDDGLTKLTEVLSLFDQIELAQQSKADQFHLTLHVKTVKPLRK